jgi:hypothetical protein
VLARRLVFGQYSICPPPTRVGFASLFKDIDEGALNGSASISRRHNLEDTTPATPLYINLAIGGAFE